MRKILLALLSVLVLGGSHLYAETNVKEQIKANKEVTKASQKNLNKKASKIARKEAKKLTKEGWKVAPGALPLEKQLDRAYLMQYEYTADGMPKYIAADAMSIGGNYDAAKMQALELAKQNLAGQIQTEITALVENSVANEQMDQSDAASITRSVLAGKNLISQNIGRMLPMVETYRVVNGNNREVLVRILYSVDAAHAVAKKVIQKDLEERGEKLHGKLDDLIRK